MYRQLTRCHRCNLLCHSLWHLDRWCRWSSHSPQTLFTDQWNHDQQWFGHPFIHPGLLCRRQIFCRQDIDLLYSLSLICDHLVSISHPIGYPTVISQHLCRLIDGRWCRYGHSYRCFYRWDGYPSVDHESVDRDRNQ